MSAAKVQRKTTEAYQQGLNEVLAALNTDSQLGLSQAEAQVRLEKHGWNVFNGELELRRLALLRGCGELGAVAA